MSPAQPMNLVVYLARSGIGSRRSCDELIREGVVTVNDEVVTFPRQKVGPEDVVAVRGVYLMGRVVRVEDRTCAVMPITQKGFGKFDGVLVLAVGHGVEERLECLRVAPAALE